MKSYQSYGTYRLDSMIPWVRTSTVLPLPQKVAPTVKVLATGSGVMPDMGRGNAALLKSRRVKLNVKSVASQSFSTETSMMYRGTLTGTGI